MSRFVFSGEIFYLSYKGSTWCFLLNPCCLVDANASKSVSSKGEITKWKQNISIPINYLNKTSGRHRLFQDLKKKHAGEQGKMLQRKITP